jgi:hypothetical protein
MSFNTWSNAHPSGQDDPIIEEHGLCMSQYPSQFASYLLHVLGLDLPIKTYIELGVDKGGSFVATVEFFRHFNGEIRATGVDPLGIHPNLVEYGHLQRFTYVQRSSTDPEFKRSLSNQKFDLCFIDAVHDYASVSHDFGLMADYARIIAFHDVCGPVTPGSCQLWSEIKSKFPIRCHECVEQYYSHTKRFGIGVFVNDYRL